MQESRGQSRRWAYKPQTSLGKHHPELWKTISDAKNDRKRQKNADFGLPQTKKADLDEKVAQLFIATLLPFSLVDRPEFREFVAALCPGYEPCSKTHLSGPIVDHLYARAVSHVQEELKSMTSISITSDIWTSIAQDA